MRELWARIRPQFVTGIDVARADPFSQHLDVTLQLQRVIDQRSGNFPNLICDTKFLHIGIKLIGKLQFLCNRSVADELGTSRVWARAHGFLVHAEEIVPFRLTQLSLKLRQIFSRLEIVDLGLPHGLAFLLRFPGLLNSCVIFGGGRRRRIDTRTRWHLE